VTGEIDARSGPGSGPEAGAPGDGTEPLPDDLRRQLESLGYLGRGN
jgi:hypothetical protein